MIKLKQVATVYGETTLVFEADFPDGLVREVRIPAAELIERMRALRQLVGRELTLKDARDIIVAVVNQMRVSEKPLVERFDFSQFIGVDFEQ